VSDELICLNLGPDCSGPVEYRMPLSGTGHAFPRCDHHWEQRLDEQERINRTYPVLAPRDFDPLDAGESWDGDDFEPSPDPDWMNP
jgi:hypothetical protein